MTFKLFALILSSVLLSAVAQFALKLGTGAARQGTGAHGEVLGFLQSPMIWLGLSLYGFGALLWLFVLARAPLSLAYPFVGLGFVLTMGAGALLLGENVGAARILGTVLIAGGCVLVARSA